MEDLLKVGVITTTHGVRGEVKVFPTTDDAERFLDIEYVLLDTGKELRRLNIQNVKFFKNLAILKFEGIDNINDIEMYKGRELWIPREEAQELGEDEYYVADLIGMEVLLENGEKFGVLRDVMETGANDVYIVDRVDGEEILLPAIHDCVLDVDVEKKYHDCTFDERACLNELSCTYIISGNDRERNEHKYYRPCHYKGTVITGSNQYTGFCIQ